MKLRQEVVDAIRKQLSKEFSPLKIVLFGSYAKGTADADSDIDLMVIVNDEKMTERTAIVKGRLALRQALKGMGFSFDLLVETERDFDLFKKRAGSIENEVSREGITLYGY